MSSAYAWLRSTICTSTSMQPRAGFVQSRQPACDDHGHARRGQDLGAHEPFVAEQELAHVVPLDGAARREVVLHDQPARRDEVEDRFPVVGPPTVGEDEIEGTPAVQLLVGVPLQEFDVGGSRQAPARDRGTLGIALDRDDGARGLGEQPSRLSEGGAQLGDVTPAGEHAQQRLHLGDGGRPVRQRRTMTASIPARSSSSISSSDGAGSSAIASLPAGTSGRRSRTASSVPVRTISSGSSSSSARSSCSSSPTRTARSTPAAAEPPAAGAKSTTRATAEGSPCTT